MGLKSINGTYLQDEWKAAANTFLGTTISGYPNMFHLYGPHGPTLLSNGPSSVEIQGRWIRDAINKINRDKIKYINPTKEASDKWKQRVNDLAKPTLFPTTKSTYMGGVSIPSQHVICWRARVADDIVGPSWEGVRDDLLRRRRGRVRPRDQEVPRQVGRLRDGQGVSVGA